MHRHLMPICESSVSLVAQALKDAKRRAVTPENLLIEDFGHMSPAGAGMMQALADSLMSQLAAKGPNKIKMLFEWRHLYSQVADLSANQVDDILRSIGFNLTCRCSKRAPRQLLPKHQQHDSKCLFSAGQNHTGSKKDAAKVEQDIKQGTFSFPNINENACSTCLPKEYNTNIFTAR